MRTIPLALTAALCATGCGEPETALRGTLAGDWPDGPLAVSAGEGEPREVRGGAFRVTGLPEGAVELRISSPAGTVARIALEGLPSGEETRLERIRRGGGGLAFPSRVRVPGGGRITVNGLRMADTRALPSRLEAPGELLALDAAAGYLLVRAEDASLPDLPVVVTEATLVRRSSGDTARLSGLSPGDTVGVEGPIRGGYLHAERITLAAAAPPPRSPAADPAAAPAPSASRPPSPGARSPAPAAAGRDGPPRVEERRPGRGKGRGQGRGQGRGGRP
jgi:hypothetical protein